jgi:hydrogenase 3 maturation protease
MRNPQLAPALTRALSAGVVGPEAGGPAGAGPMLPRGVVLLGVGSELRGDDAAGIRIAQRMESLHLPGVSALDGGTAPENLTGEIRRLSPSHLIIIDSADMGDPPGAVRLLDPDDIGGMSFGTHALPLSVLAGFLSKETGCRVTIMGIQPRSLEFDAGLSREVAQAVDEAIEALAACLTTTAARDQAREEES